jgi:hypothetical protein
LEVAVREALALVDGIERAAVSDSPLGSAGETS